MIEVGSLWTAQVLDQSRCQVSRYPMEVVDINYEGGYPLVFVPQFYNLCA